MALSVTLPMQQKKAPEGAILIVPGFLIPE